MDNEPITNFDPSEFFDALNTTRLGRNGWFFNELTSSNQYLKNLDSTDTPHGSICLCDSQTAGKGQYQRSWDSEPGKNLTFSVVLKPSNSDHIQLLPQVMALSIVDCLESLTKIKAELKWPNDILINGKKICGILSEGVFQGSTIDRLILGMGINVNQIEFNLLNRINAVSLRTLTDIQWSREDLLARICNEFEKNYQLWIDGDTQLVRRINKKYPGLGKPNSLELDGILQNDSYMFLGLDIDGYPLFLNGDYTVKKFKQQSLRFKMRE